MKTRGVVVLALFGWSTVAVPAPGMPDLVQSPAEQTQKPRKPPSAILIEPWPDAAKRAERRADAEARRLFQQSDPLVLSITADFKAVNRDRDPSSKKTFPATLTAEDAAGTGLSDPVPVTLRARGHARRAKCALVPLSIDFPRKSMSGTVFDGQGRLKLVAPCYGQASYEQYVLREYLAYKLHALITPMAFRVRLAKVAFIDAKAGKKAGPYHAFLIEDDSDLARRLEGRVLDMPRVPFKDIQLDSLTRLMLFQYMIGNTDFSIYGLHNANLLQTVDGAFHPIVWDFDISGLVDVPYGLPDPRLKIASIRERLYRGPCRTMAEYEPLLAAFRAKEAEALALFDLPALSERDRRDARRYLEEFFSLLGRPAQLKRELVDGCRPTSLM